MLKDIIVKYQLLAGRKVKFIPGWDCHGLPIELKVESPNPCLHEVMPRCHMHRPRRPHDHAVMRDCTSQACSPFPLVGACPYGFLGERWSPCQHECPDANLTCSRARSEAHAASWELWLSLCLQVLQSMTAEQREKLEGLKLRYKARDFALKTVAKQRDQFKRCLAPLPGGPATTDRRQRNM